MITPETVIALAIQNQVAMDQLGEALRSDIVTANPYYRRIVEFGDSFLLQRRKLPGLGDWEIWLNSLEEGMLREGTKEALGRLLSVNVAGYDPEFFAANVIGDLQRTAAQVARARLNEAPQVDPATLALMAEKVAAVQSSGLKGLARLSDVNIWAQPVREEELIPTGYPTLDRLIGGWGKELWIAFADSKMGKSILLQCFASNMAVRGKNILHITLELALRPLIHRYYRQLSQMSRAEFNNEPDVLRNRLAQWFRLSSGSIYLLELPPYTLTPDKLKRLIDRLNRTLPVPIDGVVIDYLDLMALEEKSSRGDDYRDLGRLTHSTRQVCSAFDVPVLTVSQSVRKPAKAGRLTMQDMGDSYNKVRAADGLLSLNQTPEEEEVFQGRMGLVNVRDSGGRGEEIPLYINRELSLIQELDHPNTVQLMRRLGQLPAQARLVQQRGMGVSAG